MKKEKDMLRYLINLYKDLYNHKDLFSFDFKFSPNEIEEVYKDDKTSFKIDKDKQRNCEIIGNDILALKTPESVREFMSSYNLNDKESKDNLIKKLNLQEFAYLYEIIYSSPLKSNMRKIDAFNSIDKYFYGISRADSIRP